MFPPGRARQVDRFGRPLRQHAQRSRGRPHRDRGVREFAAVYAHLRSEVGDQERAGHAVGSAGVHAMSHRVDAAQILHEEGLAFHYPESSGRSGVAVAEDAHGIRYDGHEFAPIGKGEGPVVLIADRGRYGGDSRSLADVEPVEAPEPVFRAGTLIGVETISRFDDIDSIDGPTGFRSGPSHARSRVTPSALPRDSGRA